MRTLRLFAILLCCVIGSGCRREPPLPQATATAPVRPAPPQPARTPEAAVTVLVERLRARDGVGYARLALPPPLHARVEAAWREGRSHWPLDELPLESRLPRMLAALSASNAEADLDATFDRQFAGADADIDDAIRSLDQFGRQYVDAAPDYTAAERSHLRQLIGAMSSWAQQAPLSDPARARPFFARLAQAARRTGIDGADDYAQLGMQTTLERLAPFLGTLADAFAEQYGLDLDAALASVRTQVVERRGDHARVEVDYVFAGTPVKIVIPVTEVDGAWYLDGQMRDAARSLESMTADARRSDSKS